MVIDAAKGRGTADPQNCLRSVYCATSPFLPLSIRWIAKRATPYDLLDEIEYELGIKTYPMNWPIGCGKEFKGVYDRNKKEIIAFRANDEMANGQRQVAAIEADLSDPNLAELIGEDHRQTLVDDVELLDGAGYEFDLEAVAPRAAFAGVLLVRRSPILAWSRSWRTSCI